MSRFKELEFKVRKIETHKEMDGHFVHERMKQIEHLLFVAREDMGALRHRIELLEKEQKESNERGKRA